MGWPAGLLTGDDAGHAAGRSRQRRTLVGGDSARIRHFRNDAEYGPGVRLTAAGPASWQSPGGAWRPCFGCTACTTAGGFPSHRFRREREGLCDLPRRRAVCHPHRRRISTVAQCLWQRCLRRYVTRPHSGRALSLCVDTRRTRRGASRSTWPQRLADALDHDWRCSGPAPLSLGGCFGAFACAAGASQGLPWPMPSSSHSRGLDWLCATPLSVP